MENNRKNVLATFSGTNVDFLRDCEIKLKIESSSESNFSRSYELVQRTNQLNLSGRKYSEKELAEIIQNKYEDVFVLSCEDKYGEYGQVGFAIVNHTDDTVDIIEYVMSCRVAGKYIEPAFMAWLAKRYNAERIVFDGVSNKKNSLLINTLVGFGMKNIADQKDRIMLFIEASNITNDNIVTVDYHKV